MTNDATGDGKQLFRLDGRHALVAGVTSGFGRALAVALAEAGATVSVTTRVAGDLAETAAAHSVLNECWTLGGEGRVLEVDLTEAEAVAAAVDGLESDVAAIDVLVNAVHESPAGALGPIGEVGAQAWRATWEANVTSAFAVTRAVGPRMAERGRGRVVQLVSLLGERGVANTSTFAAGQGALLAWTRALAIEWARSGVTVNALGIGMVEGAPGPLEDASVRERLDRYVPLRRLGQPQDLAHALRYVVSDEAAFMTGELLLIDGALAVRV